MAGFTPTPNFRSQNRHYTDIHEQRIIINEWSKETQGGNHYPIVCICRTFRGLWNLIVSITASTIEKKVRYEERSNHRYKFLCSCGAIPCVIEFIAQLNKLYHFTPVGFDEQDVGLCMKMQIMSHYDNAWLWLTVFFPCSTYDLGLI